MEDRAPLIALALVAAACSGDVYTVDVTLAPHLLCDREVQPMRWLGVEVVREAGDGLEVIGELTQCLELDDVRRADQLFTYLRETGLTVEGVPADARTILRFVGYGRLGEIRCPASEPRLCGITCPPVSEDALPPEGVKTNFVCAGLAPEIARAFDGCLSIEGLTDDDRGRICSNAE